MLFASQARPLDAVEPSKAHPPLAVEVRPPRPLSAFEHSRLDSLIQAGFNEWEAEFCVRRLIEDEPAFLEASAANIEIPILRPALAHAAQIISRNQFMGNSVYVAGDFDVDGITASSIMVDALQRTGVNVMAGTPCRQDEGYGLNRRLVDEAARHRCKLLIAVDFASTQREMVTYAQRKGMEVIIADHHQARFDDQLAKPSVFINPSLRAGDLSRPCAAGIAFLLTRELESYYPQLEESSESRGALAALGSVADMVPLLAANRAIVRRYLPALARHPGLAVLAKEIGVPLDNVSATDVAFQLAPRLNAPGRVTPLGAYECLALLQGRAKDPTAMAQSINTWNVHRKHREFSDFQVALELLSGSPLARAIVVASERFDPGVAGLVASRLSERFHRPCAVICWCERAGGRASVRGAEPFDVYQALAASKDLLIRFGGHHAAGGFTIRREQLEAFSQEFINQAQLQLGPFRAPTIEADFQVSLSILREQGEEILNQLRRCEPYGSGNESPIFFISNAKINRALDIGKDHSLIELEQDGSRMDAYAWRGRDFDFSAKVGQTINAACTFSRMLLSHGDGNSQRSLHLQLVGF